MGNCWNKVFGCCCNHNDDGDSNSNSPTSQNHNAELARGNVQLVTNMQKWETMLSEASRDGKIVVVNFSASWCTPCKTIAQTFSELADKYPSIMFLTVDVDELAEFSTSWQIRATPTFFFLRDGQQVDKLVGANKPELLKKIAAIVDLASRTCN